MTPKRIAQLEQMLERGTVCKGHIWEMLGAIKHRAWVGLTEADWKHLYDEFAMGQELDEFAEAIEAKLKEKNT